MPARLYSLFSSTYISHFYDNPMAGPLETVHRMNTPET